MKRTVMVDTFICITRNGKPHEYRYSGKRREALRDALRSIGAHPGNLDWIGCNADKGERKPWRV
jgi:hypothetical protein